MTGREDNHSDIADNLHNALAAFFQQTPDQSMVLKWTLQIEVLDRSGENALWTLSMPDMALWERQAFSRHALQYYDFVQTEAYRRGEE